MRKKELQDNLRMLEVVLDALISLLHKKNVVKRDEIQLEILEVAGRKGGNDLRENESQENDKSGSR